MSTFSKQLLLLACVLGGCASAPAPPRKAAHPLPQHLLGAWSAKPVAEGRQPDFVFSADAAPCDGQVRVRFGNGLTHDTPVRWTTADNYLIAQNGDAEVARLSYAPDGLQGILQLSQAVISPDGQRAQVQTTPVQVAGVVPRKPAVPLFPGAVLRGYVVDRVTAAGEKQLVHCEVFQYHTPRPPSEVHAYYARLPRAAADGFWELESAKRPDGTAFELLVQR
jgi:hypothetical protein